MSIENKPKEKPIVWSNSAINHPLYPVGAACFAFIAGLVVAGSLAERLIYRVRKSISKPKK